MHVYKSDATLQARSLVGRWGGSGNNKGGTKIILFTEIYMIMIEIHDMTNVSNYITQNSWLY